MRRFIYYDKDGIESYLAQITSGISVSTIKEASSEVTKNNGKVSSRTVHSDISAKLAGIGAEILEDVNNKDSSSTSTNDLVKSIEEKVLSDYAFDKVYEYFEKQKMFTKENFKIGDIIDLNENVIVFDIEYFEKLFDKNGLMNYTINQRKNELNEYESLLRKEGKKAKDSQILINKFKDGIKDEEKNRQITLDIVNMTKNTLPYKRFIMTQNCLVVLNDDDFRDNPNNVAFKYGGDIHIVGYVTNIIKEEENLEKNKNAFSDMYDAINRVMMSLYNIDETKEKIDTIYVIHPLAMFY